MSDIVDSENSGLNENNDRIIQTDLRNEMSFDVGQVEGFGFISYFCL